MELVTYEAFADEIKLAGAWMDRTKRLGRRVVSRVRDAVNSGIETASSAKETAQKAGRTVRLAPKTLVNRAKSKLHDATKDVSEQASKKTVATGTELGDAIGSAIKSHASDTGGRFGRSLASHSEEAGSKLVHGAWEGARSIAKRPGVIAGTAAIGAGLIGLGAHHAYRQNKRDQIQDRIAESLEAIARRKRET